MSQQEILQRELPGRPVNDIAQKCPNFQMNVSSFQIFGRSVLKTFIHFLLDVWGRVFKLHSLSKKCLRASF